MPHDEGYFDAPEGLRLYHQRWLPEGAARGVVAVVHGFTEHSSRYAHLADVLNRRGYAVYAMDLRGHGRSEGQRVFIRSFHEYLADLDLLLDHVAQHEPDRPVFLFGHSLGGIIVAAWGLRAAKAEGRGPKAEGGGRKEEGASAFTHSPSTLSRPPRGLILSAPGLQLGPGVFPVLRRLAPLIGRVLPRLRLLRMGSSGISRDPAVVERFRKDPLVFHDRFPMRTASEIIRTAKAVVRRAEDLCLPLLLLQGTGDRVVDVAAVQRFFTRAGATDKTLKLYEGLYHEPLSEPERDQVAADLVSWLDTHG